MTLTLGYSPCPNDTFLFDAMIHGRIDTEGLTFEVQHHDVETLNTLASHGVLDITKLSYHAYAYVSAQYILLHAGSALGRGCGPLLISKDMIPASKVPFCVIGIPGTLTTANFLLSMAYPDALTKKVMLFSEIEDALLRDAIDAGLIIHENRFTYAAKGLHKITDLGSWWVENYDLPIPLGGIAIRRDHPAEIQQKVQRVLRNSVLYAMEHPDASMEYVRAHAQEMDADVMRQHIALYVNDFSVDLGAEGVRAIEEMYRVALQHKKIPGLHHPILLEK